jgi:hypothetical protein
MEKEFIPYEQVLALKELGFDEPCYVLCIDTLDGRECTRFTGYPPLYQQAFRWFREKYGLWQIVMQNTDKDWTYDIMTIVGMTDYKIFDVFDTYEEAELECLKKLIEIVKEKK